MNDFEKMSPYERDQNRKHIVAECLCWLILLSGVVFLAISFFGGK